MGGGGWYYVPKVWSPAGGWWATPKQWKANTVIAAGAIVVMNIAVFTISSSKERRPIAPYKHIPSQKWCKFAKVDDPSLK